MRDLISTVFSGNDQIYAEAVEAVDKAIAQYGADHKAQFPNTGYNCATILQYSGIKVTTLADLKTALDGPIKEMMTRDRRVDSVFSSGLATCMAGEAFELCKYIENDAPYGDAYHGHMSDAEVRTLGVPLVTGDIPGFVVIVGEAPSDDEAYDLVKGYQKRGIFVFLIGGCIEQVKRKGFQCSFDVRVVDVGPDSIQIAHIISLVMRAAMIFGNVQPMDYWAMNNYTFDRIRAFVNAYDYVTDRTVGFGAGAICLGFPVISNADEPNFKIPKSLILQPKLDEWIETSLEARDIKLKITEMDIPVAFNSSFEGEIIRRGDMQFEVYGAKSDSFELVTMKDAAEIEDHKIEVIGPDFDTFELGSTVQMAYIAEVAGKKMQSDFESVIDRKFHAWINCLESIYHTGQREQIRIRISKNAFAEGFRAKHLGEMLWAMIKSEYGEVVDKCQVKVVTDSAECSRLKKEVAMPKYNARDERLESLTDEAADVFFTCTMCQSFSPSHVCIVTPERLGLCGAVSWLDAKATHQLNPEGPCQVVSKENPVDEEIGIWPDCDRAVNQYSHGALEHVTLYSILQDPMTSCGCFECICGMEPASNGVVIVNREYAGQTPVGMSFAELASFTGGGAQTPGYMGHGKHFIASKKFMKAEGGIQRIVWMPKALKEEVAARLNKSAFELYGIENFSDMIADETVAASADDLDKMIEFLTEKGHPALGLDPMI